MGPEANVLHTVVRISWWLFLNCRFILTCAFSWTLQSAPSQSYNKEQARCCSFLNHRVRRCRVCWFLNCIEVHLAVWLLRRKHYRPRHRRTGIRIGLLTNTYWKTTFLPRVTLTVTQVTLLVPISHSGLKIQTIDLLYLYSAGLQGFKYVTTKQSHPTPIQTLPLLAFWPQEKEDELHPWAD